METKKQKQMNPIEVNQIILKNNIFMQDLARRLGDPVNLPDEACLKIYAELQANRIMEQKFAICFNLKKMDIVFKHNIEKFLGPRSDSSISSFLLRLHPDFLEDFIKWGQAIYEHGYNDTHIGSEPLESCSRMTVPLKLTTGCYYWALQEIIGLQVDATGKLVTHLNIYTLLHPLDLNEGVKMVARLYNHGFEEKNWTFNIWKDYFTKSPFQLTPQQNRIIEVLRSNSHFTNSEIALALGKKKNNIDIQNKQILARARSSFRKEKFENVHEVVGFLRKLGYFADTEP
jgi:hypothetical protein